MRIHNRIFQVICIKFQTCGLAVLLFTFFTTCSDRSGLKETGKTAHYYAFTDVNVIPLDRERILRNHTVITENNQIVTIGPSEFVKIPSNAQRINGRGKYLMPGLSDMHVHTWAENDMILFLANGVTTIRLMYGSDWQLELREKIDRGELPGPRIYLCGDFINSSPPESDVYLIVNDPGEVPEVIKEQKEAGYDFIKILEHLSPRVFDAVIAEAGIYNIPVVGHAPLQVEFDKVLESGMNSIEHFIGYDFALMSDDVPEPDIYGRAAWLQAWQYFDSLKLPGLVRKTREKGVWNCPTLVAFLNGRPRLSELEQKFSDPILRYVHPEIIKYWHEREYIEEEALITRETDWCRKMTLKAFHDAGCRLLIGTDANQFFIVHGFSVHEELQHFVAAGLTPFEAIRIGTTNAAEYLGTVGESGKVAVGYVADLVLLNENPLENIRNTKSIAGVMCRGKWFSESELEKMLEDIAVSYEEMTSK